MSLCLVPFCSDQLRCNVVVCLELMTFCSCARRSMLCNAPIISLIRSLVAIEPHLGCRLFPCHYTFVEIVGFLIKTRMARGMMLNHDPHH